LFALHMGTNRKPVLKIYKNLTWTEKVSAVNLIRMQPETKNIAHIKKKLKT